jgi:NAD(P)-dependent dehydrogenase (short-subunit alcohol dehydrogenase family)
MKRPSMFDLTGQTMLVTGAASGIGLAISEALLDAGAAVVMADMDGEQLAQQAARLKDQFPQVSTVQIDVRDTLAVDRMVDDIITQLGAIDAVFANAGISAGRGFMVETGRLENIDMDAWHKVMSVNARWRAGDHARGKPPHEGPRPRADHRDIIDCGNARRSHFRLCLRRIQGCGQ